MSKITYITKTLVDFEDDAYIWINISTNNWSNLLEAAVKNNLEEVRSLMNEATYGQIKFALSTLESAFEICTKYQDMTGGWRSGLYDEATLGDLIKARTNLLWNLKDSHYLNITLSKTDQRLIENRLLEEVKNLTTLQTLVALYNQYENSPKLNHHRNPHFDAVRSTLFQKKYSSLKINFIEALQIKALDLLKKSDSLQSSTHEIHETANTIFLSKHQFHGVSKTLTTEFTTHYLNQVSSKIDLEI